MSTSLRIISGILSFVIMFSPFGFAGDKSEGEIGGVKQVTVAADGSGDYTTLEEARDYVRTLDKTKYCGIDVLVKSGNYTVTETLTLAEEDSGTENCPIRYIGEDGANFYGGVTFTAADFEPLGDGEVIQYFPDEVKDHLVQIDLKKFGFTLEDARKIAHSPAKTATERTFLFCNGEKMNVARFPNQAENEIDSWAKIRAGSTLEPEWTGDTYSGQTEADYYIIRFAEEYNERVHSWHDIYDGYVEGRFTFLWCSDGSTVAYLDPEEPMMKLYFAGGYQPREGMVFYWYHIPEELDIPGEYYVDDDCILYYYPTDAHETATYSMPTLNGHIITLDGAEYLTFDNLSLMSSRQGGICGEGNNIMIDNCTIMGVLGNGIRLDGSEITVQNCTVSYVGKSGIHVTGGDVATLTRANNLIYNNYVSHWSIGSGIYEMAISSRTSCGTTISHNEICHSVDWGIEIAGAYNTVEYNHCYDLSRFIDDQAVIHVCTTFGGIVRYNYIHDAGFFDDEIGFMGISGMDSDFTLGQVETYGNIVCNVSGNGELMCNPRNASVHDNLFISCRKGAVKFTDNKYNDILRLREENDILYYGDESLYLQSEVWLKEFPWLADIKMVGTIAEGSFDDPNFWAVPANSSVKNNFVYIDKANIADPGKLTRVYEYWDICDRFSEIVNPTNDEMIIYSSKRTGHPDIKEALEKAAGTINLPYEEFEKIGRVE